MVEVKAPRVGHLTVEMLACYVVLDSSVHFGSGTSMKKEMGGGGDLVSSCLISYGCFLREPPVDQSVIDQSVILCVKLIVLCSDPTLRNWKRVWHILWACWLSNTTYKQNCHVTFRTSLLSIPATELTDYTTHLWDSPLQFRLANAEYITNISSS